MANTTDRRREAYPMYEGRDLYVVVWAGGIKSRVGPANGRQAEKMQAWFDKNDKRGYEELIALDRRVMKEWELASWY